MDTTTIPTATITCARSGCGTETTADQANYVDGLGYICPTYPGPHPPWCDDIDPPYRNLHHNVPSGRAAWGHPCAWARSWRCWPVIPSAQIPVQVGGSARPGRESGRPADLVVRGGRAAARVSALARGFLPVTGRAGALR